MSAIYVPGLVYWYARHSTLRQHTLPRCSCSSYEPLHGPKGRFLLILFTVTGIRPKVLCSVEDVDQVITQSCCVFVYLYAKPGHIN